jgi:hypothetical protein
MSAADSSQLKHQVSTQLPGTSLAGLPRGVAALSTSTDIDPQDNMSDASDPESGGGRSAGRSKASKPGDPTRCRSVQATCCAA